MVIEVNCVTVSGSLRSCGSREIRYRSETMRLTGLEQGVAALKSLGEKDKEYLKFLIKEAQSNTDLRTTFKGPDGTAFVLRLDVKSGDLVIEAPAK